MLDVEMCWWCNSAAIILQMETLWLMLFYVLYIYNYAFDMAPSIILKLVDV